MNFTQFTNTQFYITTFNHMLTKYTEEFTKTVLRDLYFRMEYKGTLETIA